MKKIRSYPICFYTWAIFVLFPSCQPKAQSILLPDFNQETVAPPTRLQHVELPALPESFSFAGEEMPLSDPEVRDRLEQALIVYMYSHNNTLTLLKRIPQWKPVIMEILKEEGVPEDFFYLAIAESSLNEYARSSAGAVGMWQFMEAAGKENGLEITKHVDERRDPFLATRKACAYLKKAYQKFGSWTLAAASYNRGMAGLQRALEGQKVNDFYQLFLNPETYRYVFSIAAAKIVSDNPEAYGFFMTEEQKLKPWAFDTIEVTKDIPDLADFAASHQLTYLQLKRYNPWLDGNDYSLKVHGNKTYTIRIPKKK